MIDGIWAAIGVAAVIAVLLIARDMRRPPPA
jgi:hypothetical protein